VPTRPRPRSRSPRAGQPALARATDRRVERIDRSPVERLRAAILLGLITVALSTLMTLAVIGAVAASAATLAHLVD
jgi:hypothetical protein